MIRTIVLASLSAAIVACQPASPPTAFTDTAHLTQGEMTLGDARAQYATKLTRKESDGGAPDKPPAGVFDLVKFTSPAGQLSAYLTPAPAGGGKHPAMIWITGGDHATIGDVWSPRPRDNDQSASQLRKAGIVMMFPSQRGGNDNPGFHEGMYGEVADISAAFDYLLTLDYVDPARIYLGGHSTGGTMALLVAESDARFRATFAFGPVTDPRGYGRDFTPYNTRDRVEIALRAPILWLDSLRSPTFVIEGESDGNADDVRALADENKNKNASFFVVKGQDHFSVLAPALDLIAKKIKADTGATSNISLTLAELNAAK